MRPLELRGYQVSAIDQTREALRRSRRVIIASPTGSGKTEVGMAIIQGAVEKGKRVAFLCNRVHLVTQTSRRFHRAGIRHGIIQGQNTTNAHAGVLVASIQTVAKRGLPAVDLLVIDEAHGAAGSKEYRALIEFFSGIPTIGLSATPFSKGLGKHYDSLRGPLFEEMVIAASIQELIDQGYLVDADVYAPSKPDLTGVKITAGDYNEKQLAVAVDKPTLIGDIVQHWLRLANGTPTVCFATDIAHSKHITEQFVAAGIAAEHIDFRTEDEERKAVLARVESGETKVISNVGILAEGWDFPACKTLILARPTKSLIRYLQMAGRVLRPFPGKDRALILDHSGVVEELGFVTDPMPMHLDDGKPGESSAREVKEKLPKPCPMCKYMKPRGVHICPRCGFAPERQDQVEVKDGELKKLEKGAKKKNALAAMGKQEVYSQLLHIADERGYKRGWAANQYRGIFEVWPRGLSDHTAEPSYEIDQYVRSQLIRFAKAKLKEEPAHA